MTQTLRPPSPVEIIPDTMRAAVLYGPGDIRVTETKVPRPGALEVLVRVAVCGTCGTDLKILGGHFPLTPPYGTFTPGHEWAGTVVEVGEGVGNIAIGDRVCIEAHHGCGYCDNCIVGNYTSCLNYGVPGSGQRASGLTANGGFAEYAVHHISSIYKLPENVSFEDAVLVTTAGTGLFGLDVAGGFIAGDNVVVTGPGPVGLMTTLVCKELGANSVILVGTRSSRLEIGRRLGVDVVINSTETDPVAAVLQHTGGEGADLVIEASGSNAALEQCLASVKRGGKALVVAFYPDKVTFDLSDVVRKGVSIYTSRGEGGNVVRRALSLAAQGRLKAGELVTHRFSLDEIQDCFRVVAQRTGDPLKAVIVP
jgi:L-iditol 2-dehydrogenase